MKLYQICLLCLLFTYISSICTGTTAAECAKLELDDSEKQAGGVACCLTKFSNQYMCTKTDKDTYEKVLKGETIEVLGTTYEYHCSKAEDKKEAEKSSSGANNLALSLLIVLFFTLL